MKNIDLGEASKKAPNQTAMFKLLASIAIGYLVSSFFIQTTQMIMSATPF